MKVFFAAPTEGNTGPANANRGLFENWPQRDEVRPLRGGGRIAKLLCAMKGALWCDVVVSGGPGALDSLASSIARARKAPVVGYCHGYAPFENEVNRLGMPEGQVRAFADWLDGLDAVATNSDLQRRFLESCQPALRGKVESTLLGVEPFPVPEPRPPRAGCLVVATSGGTRPIKGNDVVARAVLMLREEGVDAELRVYGRDYSENPGLDALVKAAGSYRGQVGRGEFLSGLGEADVFVMDSRHESFGLSALDALASGCSLLISENCGVGEILQTEDCDVVRNCEDVGEVARKIAFLAEHPNCARLCSGIDFESCGWPAAAGRLRDVCARAVERSRER